MATLAPHYGVARFSSSDLPRQGRGKAIEELHERGLLGFKFTPLGKALPHVEFVNRSMFRLRIITATYAGVRHDALLAAPVVQQLIVNHFYDLTALSLRPTCDLNTLVETSSVSAVRLAAIKADIVADLNDGDLNVTMVASRNRVTVRYLHKLFESEGIT